MNTWLADYSVSFTPFLHLDELFLQFQTKSFRNLSARKKFAKVNQTLLECIQNSAEPCFLLPSVIDFISKVQKQELLQEPYRMLNFEFWLNHFSGLTDEENRRIRNKIVGKNIPREEYQAFFPIGMGKMFNGSHFVAAHLAPDVDTTIASFWGWIDAFAARVGTGQHQWSLPGKLADSHTALLFQELFSEDVFEVLVRQTQALTLTALDLVSEKDLIKVPSSTVSSHIDHSQNVKPIIVTDETGHFLGAWRANDAEAVRQVVVVFYSSITWLENAIHEKIISVFTNKDVHLQDIKSALESVLEISIKTSDAIRECSDHQKRALHDFLKKVLGLTKGSQSTFSDLIRRLDSLLNLNFSPFQTLFDQALYDHNQLLIEDRPKLFSTLEKIFKDLDSMLQAVRNYIDRLDLLLAIKEKVLAIPSPFITLKSDVEEIRKKMENYEYLPVLVQEGNDKWFVVGVVYANDSKRELLGTVSLRDFSNELETKMASYLQVISIIDHHKSDIKTAGVSTLIIGDAQSSNTIVAELVMKINDRYSLQGQTPEHIDEQLQSALKTCDDLKKVQRLLQLKRSSQMKDSYYIHPKREFAEYLCFLLAILDDTDLLTKVSLRDVMCVKELLNRMKTIGSQNDCECISFDSIGRDDTFVKQASAHILQNDDMYSLYSKIYAFKEKEVEKDLQACLEDKPSSIFSDTKEQNGCCRVGQTKLFCPNIPLFQSHVASLRSLWQANAKKVYETRPQIDLHIQMITTIAGADEVHSDKALSWKHKDELWFWVPETASAYERLVNFLNAFHATALVQNNAMEVEFYGQNAVELEQIFAQNFPKATRKVAKETTLPIAVLYYKAGLINSRKAAISPYLPRFIA